MHRALMIDELKAFFTEQARQLKPNVFEQE